MLEDPVEHDATTWHVTVLESLLLDELLEHHAELTSTACLQQLGADLPVGARETCAGAQGLLVPGEALLYPEVELVTVGLLEPSDREENLVHISPCLPCIAGRRREGEILQVFDPHDGLLLLSSGLSGDGTVSLIHGQTGACSLFVPPTTDTTLWWCGPLSEGRCAMR